MLNQQEFYAEFAETGKLDYEAFNATPASRFYQNVREWGLVKAIAIEIERNETARDLLLATPRVTESRRFIAERNKVSAEVSAEKRDAMTKIPLGLIHDASAYNAKRDAVERKYAAIQETRIAEVKKKLGKRIVRNCGGAEVTAEDEARVNRHAFRGGNRANCFADYADYASGPAI